jgi:hypothetical protein
VALVAAIALLAAFLGGDLAAAEPSETQTEVADSGSWEEADGEDAVWSDVASPPHGERALFSLTSRHARALVDADVLGARGPPPTA